MRDTVQMVVCLDRKGPHAECDANTRSIVHDIGEPKHMLDDAVLQEGLNVLSVVDQTPKGYEILPQQSDFKPGHLT